MPGAVSMPPAMTMNALPALPTFAALPAPGGTISATGKASTSPVITTPVRGAAPEVEMPSLHKVMRTQARCHYDPRSTCSSTCSTHLQVHVAHATPPSQVSIEKKVNSIEDTLKKVSAALVGLQSSFNSYVREREAEEVDDGSYDESFVDDDDEEEEVLEGEGEEDEEEAVQTEINEIEEVFETPPPKKKRMAPAPRSFDPSEEAKKPQLKASSKKFKIKMEA